MKLFLHFDVKVCYLNCPRQILNSCVILLDSVQPTILVSQIDKIINSSIDGLGYNILYGSRKRVVALDYHYQKKLLFFTDVQEKKIYRTTYGSTDVKVTFINEVLTKQLDHKQTKIPPGKPGVHR